MGRPLLLGMRLHFVERSHGIRRRNTSDMSLGAGVIRLPLYFRPQTCTHDEGRGRT